jgi:hypothetical protein
VIWIERHLGLVVLTTLLAVGTAQPLFSQSITVDSASTAYRGRLRVPAPHPDSTAARSASPDTVGQQRSRLGPAVLGFLAGAGAGFVIAHVINENQRTGEGRLENYIGIPLVLGLVTFFTVFIAKGD